ncbi:MAG: radical SAM family heme chaperone HemW [Actinomycetota bacterium]|nr:radical SAM family heme chaperone HemW [Actinomycetota bacterium]
MTVAVDSGLRSGLWRASPGFGVYVHIPFCLHRCHYCDFNTYESHGELHSSYVEALVASIEQSPFESPQATSVFFGGGTPTLLSTAQLAEILSAVRRRFGLEADAEVTIEANPETVSETSFEGLLESGFNRFSLGVQSLVPKVLAGLGRTHSGERALAAVAEARRAGATDVNVDLIYGSVWESDDEWRRSLEGVIDAGVDHVSAYALTVEEGTPLATLVTTGRVPDVDPDVQAERHGIASSQLAASGFERYEVSNWCHPGRASSHNVLYWSQGDYAAFGAGAHGHLAGTRWWNVRLPREFIAAVESGAEPRFGSETLSPSERAGEALVLGLRLTSGVVLAAFEARFGDASLAERGAEIDKLEGLGLLERSDGWLRLTERGTLVANEVSCRLL